MHRYERFALSLATRASLAPRAFGAALAALAALALATAVTGCMTGGGSSGGLIKPIFKDRLAGLPGRMQLDSSWKALTSLNSQTNSTYVYTIFYHSVFGSWDSTTVKVADGIVVGRDIIHGDNPRNGQAVPSVRISETAANLGSSAYGHSPVTLDSLYRRCLAYLDEDSSKGTSWFEMDENFILKTCGYVEHLCEDDCGPYIQLARVRWILRPLPD